MTVRFRSYTRLGVLALLAGCASSTAAARTPVALPGTQASLGSARMAPDDQGDSARTHAYILKTAEGEQQFVWIPRFEAWQLQRAHEGQPRGAWTAAVPAGLEPADASRAVFGGFYVAKYEASKGSDGSSVVVRAGTAPWTNVSFTEALRVSEAMAPGASHLIGADEWAALAVWATIHGVDVRGNTLFGKDGEQPTISFATPDGKASLSGSGTSADWAPGVNLTSHTGREDGVMDLVGGVREWNSNLYLQGNQYIVQGEATGLGGTAPGYVTALSTDPLLRMYGVVGATSAAPSEAWFRGDAFHALGQSAPGKADYTHEGAGNVTETSEFFTNRGGSYDRGHFNEVAQAGMWLLCINRNATYTAPDQGFRPSLRF
ncbi:MAG: hypothetical protein EBU81_09530 [Proteobacteria bacterium]|nr:hypothetical protein [Pseudomonadota bacterium]